MAKKTTKKKETSKEIEDILEDDDEDFLDDENDIKENMNEEDYDVENEEVDVEKLMKKVYGQFDLELLELHTYPRVNVEKAQSIYEQLRKGLPNAENELKPIIIDDLRKLTSQNPKFLHENMTGCSLDLATKMIQKAIELSSLPLMASASSFERRPFSIKTPIITLNQLLGGINECDTFMIWGAPEEGKSTIAFILALSTLKYRKDGGLRNEGEDLPYILYIDTEGNGQKLFHQTLLPEDYDKDTYAGFEIFVDAEGTKWGASRFEVYCNLVGLENTEEIIDHIKVTQMPSLEVMKTAMKTVFDLHSRYKVSAIIFDSLMNNFRGEFQGRQYLPERSQLISHLTDQLMAINTYQKSILIGTNQVQTNPNNPYGGDVNSPVGGNALLHKFNQIIRVTKRKNGAYYTAHLTGSNIRPTFKAIGYKITEEGVFDVDIVKDFGHNKDRALKVYFPKKKAETK